MMQLTNQRSEYSHTHLKEGRHLGPVVQFQQRSEGPHHRKHKEPSHINVAALSLLSWEQTLNTHNDL